MSNQNVVTGEYTGTGAALNVEVGFKPSVIKIYNNVQALAGVWNDNMANGSATIESEYIDTVLDPTKPAIGTTTSRIAHAAFRYRIAGVPYLEASLAAGAAPTATTIPQNKWGLFCWEIAADGTLDTGPDAAGNAAGAYATEAAAIAAMPAPSASHIIPFYVTVMRTNAAGFVGATTAFNDAETTYNCYEYSASQILTGGITPYETNFYGFTVGTSAYLNKLGQTYYFEAIR